MRIIRDEHLNSCWHTAEYQRGGAEAEHQRAERVATALNELIMLRKSVKKLLHYSWSPIDYRYDGLAPAEKVIAPDEFNNLVAWLKALEEQ